MSFWELWWPLRFFYDFGRNLLQNQFLWWQKASGKGTPYQNRKKIVNFSSFLLKMSFWELWWHLRFFYDFGRNLLQNQFLWWKKASGKGKPYQNRKKIVNFSSFLLKSSFWEPWWHLRFFYDFGKVSLSQKLFPPQKWILKQIPTKTIKKSYSKP